MEYGDVYLGAVDADFARGMIIGEEEEVRQMTSAYADLPHGISNLFRGEHHWIYDYSKVH